jgi:class 3 adenylate cyclase
MSSCTSCGAAVPAGALFCPSCGATISDEGPREERKLATVLFADLVGSTALADSQDAERTRAVLNRFYDAMSEEIADAGGTVEKFIGDAVMAAFGAPGAQEDHADRALHAALSMRRTLAAQFGDALQLRIGVNTGDVVVGVPRIGSSFVTGDAVNVAARLEQAAKPGEILVGGRTVAATRTAFDFGPEGMVEAKGKAGGVSCRPLLRAAPEAELRTRPSFVGREGELAMLREAFARVTAGAGPAAVAIVGEPGIGKSTLVGEFRDWLSKQSPPPAERLGRCLSFGQASAYAPLGEIVREHGELLERRPILGLTLGQPAPEGLHPLAVREHLRAAWLELLAQLTSPGPAVVIVEDLHWAKPELIELLEDGARRALGPLLLLGTARDAVGWGGETVQLEPLQFADAGLMIDGLAPTSLTREVRAFVVERAGGNPFFVEELLRMLADRGVTHAIPRGLAIPDTVQALLAARIDLLSPGEKSALQAAAVIGRMFAAGPVRALVEDEPPFDRLVARGFVRADDSRFTFVHALTRDVAYGSLTTARRVRIHAGYATWLEEAGGGRDEDAAELAHHYSQAVRPEDEDLAWEDEDEELARMRSRAVVWLRRAAGLAVRRYEMREAVVLLERAVALEPDPGMQAEIWQEVAHANALYFDGKAFAAAMEEAIALVHDVAALAELYAELAFQTIARAGMWGTAPPSDLMQDWIERALELAAPDTAARAKALIARCYENYDKSAADAAEASAIADRLGDPALRSRGYDVRQLVAFVHGDYREALEWCRRRESFVHELDDADAATYVYAFAINPAVACGELDEARRYAKLHDEATRPLSPHHRLHGAALFLLLQELLGNWKQALELEELIEARVAESAATPCVLSARSLYVCALANAHLENDDETERLEAKAEPLAMSGYGTVLDTPRLLLAIHRGDLTAVESLLGEPAVRASNWFYLSSMAAHLDGLAALRERERVEREATRALRPGTYLEPFAFRSLGLVREDDELVARAARLFEKFGLDWHAARTLALL